MSVARFKPGENIPGFCTALVRENRFVKISADKTVDGDYSIAECTAGAKALGVAEANSGPTTDPRTSWTRRVNVHRGGVSRVVAGAAITAGAQVESDAQGRAITLASGIANGQALSGAAAAGDIVEVALP